MAERLKLAQQSCSPIRADARSGASVVPSAIQAAVTPMSASALEPFLAELLEQERTLATPVVAFSDAYDAAVRAGSPTVAVAPRLIPLTTPAPGEQYAFEVDLDACTGCKSCVSACHALNGLDEDETWRDVGLVVSADRRQPFTQTVTTACHHCADPACLNGCPVLAYEKDPATGIVRHLDDQCIGCSYCVLKCPYDVPKYSARRGIVRKCDMCHGRLAHGEAPACAQACPTHAIRIVTVATSPRPDTSQFLSAAPDPSYTQPTTRYVSRRELPKALAAADASVAAPQPPHWPLVFLLTLMPLAVGCSGLVALGEVLRQFDSLPPSLGTSIRSVTSHVTLIGWLAGLGGLAISVLHLGQPLRAWRIFLGLRKSWLSREAVLFGGWMALASAYLAARVRASVLSAELELALALAVAAIGASALVCSVMIYADTRRVFWRRAHTLPRFFGSAAVLSLSVALMLSAPSALTPALAATLIALTGLKLIGEARAIESQPSAATKTSRLLTGVLRPINEMRVGCALVGGILVPLLLSDGQACLALGVIGVAAATAGELLERLLFFRAVDAPKMPGSLA